MQTPEEVKKLFGSYSDITTRELRAMLDGQNSYDMYGMMKYFFGFANEDLSPAEIYGGKRFRSSLCLLIADLYDKRDKALYAALSLELYHNFTLIHDDIVDGDELRRGRPTVWKVWGKDHAINTGDAQSMLAYHILTCGSKENPKVGLGVQEFLVERYLEVIEGQFLDFTLTDLQLGHERVTEDAYFEMITKKTATLIGAATKAAGLCAELDKQEVEALWQYGFHLGMAYQICDDTVSIWGDSDMTGKTAHGDILEKKKTIPVLYALTKMTEQDKQTFVDIYTSNESMSADTAEIAVTLLDTTDVYEHMQTLIQEHKEASIKAVQKLSCNSDGKDFLLASLDALLPDVKAKSERSDL